MIEEKLTAPFIIDTIADYFGSCPKAVINFNYKPENEYRFICIYLCIKYSRWDFTGLRSFFYHRRSSQLIYGYHRVIELMGLYKDFAKKVQMAEDHLLKMHNLIKQANQEECTQTTKQ